MRIVYIISWNDKNDIGVLNKIRDQVCCWMERQHEVQVWVLTRDNFKGELPVELPGYRIFNDFRITLPGMRQAERFIRQSLSMRRIARELQVMKPDLIYYRQHIWLPWLNRVLQHFPVVMEINGLDTEELKFSNKIRRLVYMAGKNSILRRTDALVAVTHEIAAAYQAYHKPVQVIPNGIDLKKILPVKKIPHETPNLILVGSPGMPWHGIDKILRVSEKMPEFTFHIVGPSYSSKEFKNVIFHDFLYKQELYELYGKMDIGISSLASHRRNMKEGCALKVREYLAFGLPLILAYDDPDVPEHELVLKIPNEEHNLEHHLGEIIAFVRRSYDKTLPDTLRDRVNIIHKEEQRLQFFHEVLNRYHVGNIGVGIPRNERSGMATQ